MPGPNKSGNNGTDLFGEGRLVGLRAYARHRQERGLPGGTLVSVQHAVEHARIPVHQVGEEIFIDPAEADSAWDMNTRPTVGRTDGSTEPSAAADDGDSYTASRRRLLGVELELKQLKLAEMRGELVDAGQVRREAFEVGRMVRERLASLPARLASLVMATAATGGVRAIEELLAAEIHEALKALAGGEGDAG